MENAWYSEMEIRLLTVLMRRARAFCINYWIAEEAAEGGTFWRELLVELGRVV